MDDVTNNTVIVKNIKTEVNLSDDDEEVDDQSESSFYNSLPGILAHLNEIQQSITVESKCIEETKAAKERRSRKRTSDSPDRYQSRSIDRNDNQQGKTIKFDAKKPKTDRYNNTPTYRSDVVPPHVYSQSPQTPYVVTPSNPVPGFGPWRQTPPYIYPQPQSYFYGPYSAVGVGLSASSPSLVAAEQERMIEPAEQEPPIPGIKMSFLRPVPIIDKSTISSKPIKYSSKKLLVKPLHASVNEDTLRCVFETRGPIENVHLVKNITDSQGYGYVTYLNSSNAGHALIELNGFKLYGLAMKITRVKEVDGKKQPVIIEEDINEIYADV